MNAPHQMKAQLNSLYPRLLENGEALFIDNSKMEQIITCPRRAQYYICEKRELDGRKDSLNFGAGMHEGLAVRYKDFWRDGWNDKESEDRALKAIIEHFENHPQDTETFRTVDRAIDMMAKYISTYKVEPFTVKTMQGPVLPVPAVEIPFAVGIGQVEDVPIIYTGRIDALLDWDQKNWLMDHKTTSIFGGTYFEQYRNSAQFIGYCWAAEQITGERYEGALVNALALRKLTPTGKPVEFARERIEYSRAHVQEWQNNMMHIVKNFLQMIMEGYLPMHTAWCHNKFGTCQYFEVCTLPPEQRTILLNSRAFTDVTWSPLN